ncbi:uncharacterized [Tachysurus ichikawai]
MSGSDISCTDCTAMQVLTRVLLEENSGTELNVAPAHQSKQHVGCKCPGPVTNNKLCKTPKTSLCCSLDE